MKTTQTEPAAAPEAETPDERFVGLVSSLLWYLEIRQLAALYKSDDDDQALRVIKTNFREPIHRQMADRVMNDWRDARREGKTLVDVLRGLDDEEAWWIRCQLPTGVSEISETELQAHKVLAQLWEGLRHG